MSNSCVAEVLDLSASLYLAGQCGMAGDQQGHTSHGSEDIRELLNRSWGIWPALSPSPFPREESWSFLVIADGFRLNLLISGLYRIELERVAQGRQEE